MTAQESVRVLENKSVSNGYFRIRLTCGNHYSKAVPGQFVTLRIPGRPDPLLRRPFSIHRLASAEGGNNEVEILYRAVGRFTWTLSGLLPGDFIDMLGPLGKGFTLDPGTGPVGIAGGGIGVAPLVFLAERLRAVLKETQEISVFLGGRTQKDILCEKSFSDLGAGVFVSTEDGSAGRSGMVTELMEIWLENTVPSFIYACGPDGMIKAVSKIAAAREIQCEVSIETLMACGLGVCMGCAVSTSDSGRGYRHVCKDGPVFDAKTLI